MTSSNSTTQSSSPAPSKAWHTLDPVEVSGHLQTDPKSGLTQAEAAHRLSQFGPNRLKESKQDPFWKEFLEELREPLILLLIATGLVYLILGEVGDALVIFLIILTLNTIEVVNEQRATRAIASLRRLAEPTTPVVRDREMKEIAAEQIVPGDLILLQAGRRVSADAYLLEAYGLATDESSLTGESTPVDKEAGRILTVGTPLAERLNLVYAGTLVSRGRGRAWVVSTGMETQIGRLAGLAREVHEPGTPLQKAMAELSGSMVGLALGFSLVIPILGILVARQPFKTMLLTGLSLAFATIPEEMPIIITMVLALGAYRLSRQRAIVKHLQAVETLGAVTVIVTDKTGTLTENHMEVQTVYPQENQEQIYEIGVLCNDAVQNDGRYVGDPLGTALLRAAEHYGINPTGLQEASPLVSEYSFDNRRKRMSAIRRVGMRYRVAAKGAPEAILDVSTHQWNESKALSLSLEDRQHVQDEAAKMAAQGWRVIALAEKTVSSCKLSEAEAESGLVFAGLVGLADPPRPGVQQAIATCQRAGIRPVMVTGDHPLTARAIALEVGLNGDGRLLTGSELDRLSDDDLQDLAGEVSLYARTTPEHKLRIVRLLQKCGERVAVTGDGVNDAPALVAADIGVAMGETGSDVAREACDIVLADDDFTTIANAVTEGRALYENLKKGVRYYLACKIALVSISLLPVLLGIPVPFAPIQIILMELFMDLAAAATFVAEPAETGLMDGPPRNPKARFMDQAMIGSLFTSAAGLFAAVSAIYLLTWYETHDLPMAQTAAFFAWLSGHVLLAINLRSERQPILQMGLFSNRLMLAWAGFTAAVLICAELLSPVQLALKTTPLTLSRWGLILLAVFLGTFWIEVRKWVRFTLQRGKTESK